jgi:hypothetical protein
MLCRKHGVVLSPVKLWVLAMLAPERGCAWLRSRRYAANLTGLARDRPENARSGRRNSRLEQTNEHLSEGISACRPRCPPNTLTRPARAKPIDASHTEILTVPSQDHHLCRPLHQTILSASIPPALTC